MLQAIKSFIYVKGQRKKSLKRDINFIHSLVYFPRTGKK